MIDERSRSREWILESCKVNKVNDPKLMEKTIRAFSLLEALAKSGCPFLFKGGSALMLQLGCTQRLSVDIDVVCPPGTDVVAYLKPYAAEYGFGEIVPVERLSRSNVPKTHAKCFFTTQTVVLSGGIVLPLERTKVGKVVRTAFRNGSDMVYLPSVVAASVAVFVPTDPCATLVFTPSVRVDPSHWCCLLPDITFGFIIKSHLLMD
jgi:hypothetical protein